MVLPNKRQQAILELLTQQGELTVQNVLGRYGVSIATVYRDFRLMVSAGLAVKIQGGIALAPGLAKPAVLPGCEQCGQPVTPRMAFTIQLSDGGQLAACCPHCGLMLLHQHPDAQTAMAADFLFVNQVNVTQASFLVDSRVVICCAPSVLCFASREDARGFSKGFGGETLDYEAARERVRVMMSLQHDQSAH